MIEGAREPAIQTGIIEPHVFEKGIRDLSAEPSGVGVPLVFIMWITLSWLLPTLYGIR